MPNLDPARFPKVSIKQTIIQNLIAISVAIFGTSFVFVVFIAAYLGVS